MKCATRIDKKCSRGKIIIRVLLAVFVAALCIGGVYKMKKRNMRLAEEERIRLEKERVIKIEEYQRELEKEYIEFEKLFRENEDEMQSFIELAQKSILGEEEYIMIFDENEYSNSSMRSTYKQNGWVTILYDDKTFILEGNERMKETLNKHSELTEILDFIKNKGIIRRISQINTDESMPNVTFKIDTKYTPFITTNNGATNAFVYCDDSNCEKYGYRNVEGNWYMSIGDPPE